MDFQETVLKAQAFMAVGPMEKVFKTQLYILGQRRKKLLDIMKLEEKNRMASLKQEGERKKAEGDKKRAAEKANKARQEEEAAQIKAEAATIASGLREIDAKEKQYAIESKLRDRQGKKDGPAEDKLLKEAKDKREKAMKEEFEKRKKLREEDLRDQLAKAKEAAKIPDPMRGMAGFAQGFDNFRDRMKKRKEGFANTKEVAKRFERLKDKHARGIKISREDREWLKALGAFNRERKAQEAAKKRAETIQEQIKTLLEKNLQGADNGR
jgi:hypothetical protein